MSKDVDVWQATEAFVAEGIQMNPGDTVAKGHPILKGREIFFRPFEPTWDFKRDKDAAEARNEAAAAEAAAASDQAEAEAVAAQEAATVKDTLSAVGDDPAKAQEALEAELAGKNRVSLVTALQEVIAAAEQVAVPEREVLTTEATPGAEG